MRIVWYVRKYMDQSLDTGTWVNMVRHLADADDVQLVSGFRREPKDFGADVRIRYLRSIRLPGINLLTFSVSALFDMLREARATEPHVVLVDAYLVPAAIVARRLVRTGGSSVAFVLDVRTLPVDTGRGRDAMERGVFDWFVRRGARHLDGMTTITEPLADVLASLTGFNRDHIGIWSSGVNVDVYDPDICTAVTQPSELTASASPSDPVFMYHGALLNTRGIGGAVQAMSLLKQQGVGARLVLVGEGIDRNALLSMIRELDLEESVRVLPAVEQRDVPRIMCGADFGLIPFPDLECWRVSSPLKLLEYLAMERPVVATALACNTCIVGGAQYVEFAQSAEPTALAEAMVRAIERWDVMRSAAPAGRSLVSDGYSWTIQARRLRAYLQALAPEAGEKGTHV